jgi:two-component system, LytTR family, sensor kinase
MEVKIPHQKIYRLAFTTSIIFGIFSATPLFQVSKLQPLLSLLIFSVVFIVTLLCWVINFQLLRYFKQQGKNSRNDIFRYTLSIILTAFAGFALHGMAGNLMPAPMDMPKMLIPPKGSRFLFPVLQSQAMNIIILILLELTLLKDRKSKIELENTSLRLAHAEAKNLLLLRQLNPHFLFNSLSTLRSLIKRDSTLAEEYLEKLSEMLRVSAQNTSRSLISLTEEIILCRHYLEMQKVRFGEALLFTIEIPRTLTENGKVPVYSIQLLIENAIKHNALTKEKPLNIHIKGDEENLSISVSNNLQPKNSIEVSSKTGLINLGERYRILGAKEVEIAQEPDTYTVKISVLNDENSNH